MLESYGELLPVHYTKGGVPGYYPPIKGNRPELVLNLYAVSYTHLTLPTKA